MIKTIFIFLLFLFLGCSKSDDKSGDFDPVFNLAYTKLKSLEEIKQKTFYYAGIKVGNKKTSLLIPSSISCLVSEFIGPAFDPSHPTLDFAYMKYEMGQFGCEVTNSSFFLETKLVNEGELFTTIRNGIVPPKGPIVLQERIFKGILEIGFQGDYLRIEDRMSTYKREDPNEKVYLYFKK